MVSVMYVLCYSFNGLVALCVACFDSVCELFCETIRNRLGKQFVIY